MVSTRWTPVQVPPVITSTATSTATWACGQNLHHFTNSGTNTDNVIWTYILCAQVHIMCSSIRLATYLCVYPTISLNLIAVSTTVEKLLSRYIEMKAFCGNNQSLISLLMCRQWSGIEIESPKYCTYTSTIMDCTDTWTFQLQSKEMLATLHTLLIAALTSDTLMPSYFPEKTAAPTKQ